MSHILSRCSLPAHPNFAPQGVLSSQTIRSQVSLKDIVMIRACSSNPDDLNRDPSVRKTYRRNAVTKRLESQDIQVQPASSTASNGKRSAQFSTNQDVPPKKRRTSVIDGVLSPPEVRMSNAGQGMETSMAQTQFMYDGGPNTGEFNDNYSRGASSPSDTQQPKSVIYLVAHIQTFFTHILTNITGTRSVRQDAATFASQLPVSDVRQISPGLMASSNVPHGASWAMPPANIPRSSMPTHRLPSNLLVLMFF